MYRKFLGKSKDTKYQQQSTLAFGKSKDSKKANENEKGDDVQPSKRRKIAAADEEEDGDGDLPMRDEPSTTDATIETNGASITDKAPNDLPIVDGGKEATKVKEGGKSSTIRARTKAGEQEPRSQLTIN